MTIEINKSNQHLNPNQAALFEIKSLSDDGRFAGYASVFGVVDNQRDIMERGAFHQTLNEQTMKVKLLWQHLPFEPIGVITRLFEDAKGLYVEGQLLLEVARGKEAYALLKSGAVNGLSIGYSPIGYHMDYESGIRHLTQVDLWEVSLVTFPANQAAQVTVVKGSAPFAVRTSYEEINAIIAGALAEVMHHYAMKSAALKYSPDQARDDHGRWTDEGGSASSNVVDKPSHEGEVQVADNNLVTNDASGVESKPAKDHFISNKGVKFVAKHEIFKSGVYLDQNGFKTVGYGHKLLPGESYADGITHEDAIVLLHHDLKIAQNSVQRLVEVNLTQLSLMH